LLSSFSMKKAPLWWYFCMKTIAALLLVALPELAFSAIIWASVLHALGCTACT